MRVLATTGWLSDLPPDFRARLSALGRWVTIPKGKRLYSAGDEPDALYGLGEGLLDVAIPIAGGEECTVHRAAPGFWIGDGALAPAAPRSLTIEAATECQLFRIPFPDLRWHLSQHPADWEFMHRLATLNGVLAVRMLAESLSLPPAARVARLLLRLSSPVGTVEATHEDLSRLAGMSRATFRRSLAQLVSIGAVETRYGALRIANRADVEQQAMTRESDP